MARAGRQSWADMSEDSHALIQSNQFTGNVVDAEMPTGLPLQDMNRRTHEETFHTMDGQSYVVFQPEVNCQQPGADTPDFWSYIAADYEATLAAEGL